MTHKDFINSLAIIGAEYPKGIAKREIFALAKEFVRLEVKEVELLLKSDNYDHRLGAVSILDWKARDKKTSKAEKEACYHAYLNNHDKIDDWGMVDRAAPYVVGGYLYDKDRSPLYHLAKSSEPMERRTAIVSTYYFIRQNDLADTFKLAEILVMDNDEYVQKAVGSWTREAGKRDENLLLDFLDLYAATMPRITLRYAIEKLSPTTRNHYLSLDKR